MKQTSWVVQWLNLCASTAGGLGSIPGRETEIPHAATQPKTKRNDEALTHATMWVSLENIMPNKKKPDTKDTYYMIPFI